MARRKAPPRDEPPTPPADLRGGRLDVSLWRPSALPEYIDDTPSAWAAAAWVRRSRARRQWAIDHGLDRAGYRRLFDAPGETETSR